MATKLRPKVFWCNECKRWTKVGTYRGEFFCARCKETYLCDECGYEIDRYGNCLREEGHG